MSSPRAYLAGPDVFLPAPVEFARLKKEVCARHGIEGVFPLDAVLDLDGLSPLEAALRISRANEALIRSCQLVIAQVTPFRGPSADVGTAYEIGFGRALGLPVFAYSNVAADFVTRTAAAYALQSRPDGGKEDPDHMLVESFGTFDNLMLFGAIEDSGGALHSCDAPAPERYTHLVAFERCVEAAASHLRRQGASR